MNFKRINRQFVSWLEEVWEILKGSSFVIICLILLIASTGLFICGSLWQFVHISNYIDCYFPTHSWIGIVIAILVIVFEAFIVISIIKYISLIVKEEYS